MPHEEKVLDYIDTHSDHGYFVTQIGKPVASYGTGGSGTHMANEHIPVEEIIRTTKVYALTMLDLLGAE
jgi:acetylornithine deacetylase/succinyl-diaminopimelate desuccinylase-like protein